MPDKNTLATASSPYLQQHANNPVHWQPWSDAALAVATKQNKPILLSIGYASCHWCHVMAHESFEEGATAELMNQHFVNIKVDREERPDLDKIYQTAHQMLHMRSGGWPLTVFLTPDTRTPFFIGTYFPLQAKHGLPAFKEVLQKVSEYFHEQADDVTQYTHKLQQALQKLNPEPSDKALLTDIPFKKAVMQLQQQFDHAHGGFSAAPKFPYPGNCELLLSLGEPYVDSNAKNMAIVTLVHMAYGGIFDQLGGGFFRYSVDGLWRIPHFEKMLYDNAQLLSVYSLALADDLTADVRIIFRNIIQQTADWILANMQNDSGGFYCALDADSDAGEGVYYTWTREELSSALDERILHIVLSYFGVGDTPNFEGRNHFYHAEKVEQVAEKLECAVEEVKLGLAQAKKILLALRHQRPRPDLDYKILTSWNGLMIKGLLQASQALGDERCLTAANKAIHFVKETLWVDGRLYAGSTRGQRLGLAFLDDYAFMLDALIAHPDFKTDETLQAFARALTESMIVWHHDESGYGFYFTAHDYEQVLGRLKPLMDEALPAGNGVAAFVLIQLGRFFGEDSWVTMGEQSLKLAWHDIQQLPYAHHSYLRALKAFLTQRCAPGEIC